MQRNSSTNQVVMILALISLMMSPSLLSAKMYKWVDDDGNTHYTQSPPPEGITGESIKQPPKVDVNKAQEDLGVQKKRADKYLEDRIKEKEQDEIAEQEKEDKSKKCANARVRIKSYQRPRVNLMDENGNPIRATEEQRKEGLAEAQQYIKENCQKY